MRPHQILFTLASTLIFIISDSLAAHWSKNQNTTALGLLFAVAPIGYIFFGLLNKDRSLATSSGIVNMGLLIGTALVGTYLFQESINVRQIIGLGFALTAVFLLA